MIPILPRRSFSCESLLLLPSNKNPKFVFSTQIPRHMWWTMRRKIIKIDTMKTNSKHWHLTDFVLNRMRGHKGRNFLLSSVPVSPTDDLSNVTGAYPSSNIGSVFLVSIHSRPTAIHYSFRHLTNLNRQWLFAAELNWIELNCPHEYILRLLCQGLSNQIDHYKGGLKERLELGIDKSEPSLTVATQTDRIIMCHPDQEKGRVWWEMDRLLSPLSRKSSDLLTQTNMRENKGTGWEDRHSMISSRT